jgi:hypothetical protein
MIPRPSLRAKRSNPPNDRHTRESGYPVRRGFAVQLHLPLEYWITRFRG